MLGECYDFDYLGQQWVRSLDIVIFGDGNDERVKFMPDRLSSIFAGDSYRLCYDVKSEQCNVEKIHKLSAPSSRETVCAADITIGLPQFLESANLSGKSLLVDITGIKHPAFFFLFKLLVEDYKPRRLFAGYTEPRRYVPHGSTEIEEHFQLFEGYLGIRALPGFARLPQEAINKCLVAFLGFEGSRLQHVYEEVDPADEHAVAVVGFPAFRPGWQNLTIAANQTALYSTRSHRFMRTATAFSPFDAYRVLAELHYERPAEQLVIAPLGTRPHALGSVLYAIQHPESYLIYDFPIEVQQHRTENAGTCHVYHLSSFLKIRG